MYTNTIIFVKKKLNFHYAIAQYSYEIEIVNCRNVIQMLVDIENRKFSIGKNKQPKRKTFNELKCTYVYIYI